MADPEPASPSQDGIDAISVAGEWDAGDMGCGEVIILLSVRMQRLRPGAVFRLTARDLGAPEDIPAWCRLTGRRLLRAEHPCYWIEQRGA